MRVLLFVVPVVVTAEPVSTNLTVLVVRSISYMKDNVSALSTALSTTMQISLPYRVFPVTQHVSPVNIRLLIVLLALLILQTTFSKAVTV